MKKAKRAVLHIGFVLIILVIILAAAGLIYLKSHEYSPEEVESVKVFGSAAKPVRPGDSVTVMTYSIGYGVKDNEQDHYAEGGKGVLIGTAERTAENLDGITTISAQQHADIFLFQEVDIDARRSFALDEASLLSSGLSGTASAFALDHSCDYVPYPFTNNLGHVESGMLTLTKMASESAQRRALESGDSWPADTWSRKPGLLIDRVKLLDSTKELVVINLDLDAYNDDDVKLTQYKALCEYMQMEYAHGNYVIAGGCFNAVLPSVGKSSYSAEDNGFYKPLELTTENLTGGWKYCTDDSTPTKRLMNEPYSDGSGAQLYVVDGFITSPNTIVTETKTVDTDFRYSSHNPVVTTVTLVK